MAFKIVDDICGTVAFVASVFAFAWVIVTWIKH